MALFCFILRSVLSNYVFHVRQYFLIYSIKVRFKYRIRSPGVVHEKLNSLLLYIDRVVGSHNLLKQLNKFIIYGRNVLTEIGIHEPIQTQQQPTFSRCITPLKDCPDRLDTAAYYGFFVVGIACV